MMNDVKLHSDDPSFCLTQINKLTGNEVRIWNGIKCSETPYNTWIVFLVSTSRGHTLYIDSLCVKAIQSAQMTRIKNRHCLKCKIRNLSIC